MDMSAEMQQLQRAMGRIEGKLDSHQEFEKVEHKFIRDTLAAHSKVMDSHSKRLSALNGFKGKIMVLGSAAVFLVAAIAAAGEWFRK